MYKDKSVMAILPARNEEGKVGRVIGKMPVDIVDRVIVVDDGSTDVTVS